ncbi:hypothetical protein IFM89_017055 [Coptis chinensis]|uniref:Uncharacterized protein n=1 Tax=Coptis chinensis TaxID=261450 RepID=A0A835LN53_9MAGN|nr:hypothetical protein IFM89_017055 [Coptis chinensis]
MEAKSQGLERAEVNIRRIKLDEDERQYCDPAETPVRHLLDEESPGNLPFFKMERERDFELSLLTESKGDLH